MLSQDSMEFNLFHKYATSELSHSAFWAWVIKTLAPGCPPSHAAIQPLARSILERLGAEDLEVRHVCTEYKVGDGDRLDVLVVGSDGRAVLLEHKVEAKPSPAQLERYKSALEEKGMELMSAAIVSCNICEPRYAGDKEHVGTRELWRLVEPHRDAHALVREYADWLEYLVQTRDCWATKAQSDDVEVRRRAMNTPEGQWGFMTELDKALGVQRGWALYNGTSYGAPWTQLRFRPDQPDYDALFYRLEVKGVVIEFTLRQYKKPFEPDKEKRLISLRDWFAKAAADCDAPFGRSGLPKGSRSNVEEAKVFQVSLSEVSPRMLLEHLPAVHEAFTRRLAKEGWPAVGV